MISPLKRQNKDLLPKALNGLMPVLIEAHLIYGFLFKRFQYLGFHREVMFVYVPVSFSIYYPGRQQCISVSAPLW